MGRRADSKASQAAFNLRSGWRSKSTSPPVLRLDMRLIASSTVRAPVVASGICNAEGKCHIIIIVITLYYLWRYYFTKHEPYSCFPPFPDPVERSDCLWRPHSPQPYYSDSSRFGYESPGHTEDEHLFIRMDIHSTQIKKWNHFQNLQLTLFEALFSEDSFPFIWAISSWNIFMNRCLKKKLFIE